MPYSQSGLSPLAQAGADFTIWSYRSADAVATVAADGYFDPAADLLRTNDIILVCADTTRQPAYGVFVVELPSGTAVRLGNLDAFKIERAGELLFGRHVRGVPASRDGARSRRNAASRSQPARSA